MSDKPFTIKRKNLTAIKHKKEGTVNKDDAPPTKEPTHSGQALPEADCHSTKCRAIS